MATQGTGTVPIVLAHFVPCRIFFMDVNCLLLGN